MIKTLEEGMTVGELQKKHAKPITRRQKSFISRALKIGDKIHELYAKKFDLIALAQQNGLALNTPVEIDGVKWELVKPEGRFVRFNDVDLKRVPKFSRKPKEVAAAS